MPIVLSYNDVEALGALSKQAGYAPGYAQGRSAALDRNLANLQRMDRRELAYDQMDFRRREAAADRGFQQRRLDAEARLRRERIDREEEYNRRRLGAGLAEAEAEQRGRLAGTLLEDRLETARDKRLHRQTLEEIAARERYGGGSGGPRRGVGSDGLTGRAPRGDAPGLPAEEDAERAVREIGGLIPFGIEDAPAAPLAGERRSDRVETARSLAQYPTPQLRQYLSARPGDPWAPFVEALIDRRERADGTGGGFAEPGAGGGFAEPLRGLNLDQLDRLAQNPAAAERFLSR